MKCQPEHIQGVIITTCSHRQGGQTGSRTVGNSQGSEVHYTHYKSSFGSEQYNLPQFRKPQCFVLGFLVCVRGF